MEKIQPTLLKGTKDYLPEEVLERQKIVQTLGRIFEQFGYVPIETPSLTPAEIMLGKYGEDNERLVYSFQDFGERTIALPYDLTVPFSRYVATNHSVLPLPFKRYQIGKVWRAEKPQQGRLREFTQCDFDIIGSKSLLCEVEIVRVIDEALRILLLHPIKIKIGSRKLLNEILHSFAIPSEKIKHVIRVIDKLETSGYDTVYQMLKDIQITNAKELLQMVAFEKDSKKTIEKIQKHYDVTDVQTFFEFSDKMGTDVSHIEFHPALARGLDYYTGIVFEITKAGKVICGGGRYDDLCSRYVIKDSTKNFSGVGASFGLDRLILSRNQKPSPKIFSEVLVTIFDSPKLYDMAIEIYKELIAVGIKTELFFDPITLAKQMKYAAKKEIPFVVICDEESFSQGLIKVKRMDSGKQKNLPKHQLISYLKGYYESK